ncbi:uncharacterized protein LOC115627347 [Scaptodrosophila lebanonensis]|uniref:Uncharacterized protein LOC115627347 n=1 Tax=Drosophila lebanonensis TaxID=7225 RepID=A0A6J2TS18_DROLE|nr:uncharacterized protein LOC115627347 [Scaptodrosophila lebanonensis]
MSDSSGTTATATTANTATTETATTQQPEGNTAAVANLVKIVNIIESNVKGDEPDSPKAAPIGVRFSGVAPRRTTISYVPKSPQLEEIVFAEPTFTERFARYFVIVIYLCGLCSLGFFLSIYHVFFWDSRMPPVFKGLKKPPAFG